LPLIFKASAKPFTGYAQLKSAYHVMLGLALMFPLTATAQTSQNLPNFETPAPHVAILDYETGLVLYEKNAQTPTAPASMTKIMTAQMIFERLKDGRLSKDTEFTVSEEAWRRGGVKSGSSTMFLKVKSKAGVEDLLRGVIVQSGNDACIVLAESIAGSEAAFADLMNIRAEELGLTSANFTNATGWPDEEHKISTLDLARLAHHTIKEHPEYYAIYSEPSFTWNGIKQDNRNPLLGRFTGADGLKTGHTEISGYGLVASAKLGDRRRIVVLNGLGSKSARRDESLRLMRAAFDQFKVYELYAAGDEVASVPVFMGKSETVKAVVGSDVKAGLHRESRKGLKTQISYEGSAAAPITKGDKIAELLISEPGRDLRRIPLFAAEDVERRSAFSRVMGAFVNLVRG